MDWQERKKIGRPKAFRSPEHLWEIACDYFKSVDDNPFKKQELIKGGMLGGVVVGVDAIRPYTWNGLHNYLWERSIISDLDAYKSNFEGRYGEYMEIIGRIDRVIFNQKFEGAAVGAFNANIIARELGLAEKQELRVQEEQPLFGEDDKQD